jgi:ribosomal protein S18 acetylase RimI-like enzyme
LQRRFARPALDVKTARTVVYDRPMGERHDEIRFEAAGPSEIDLVRPLWLALHRHHRQVASYSSLVADEQASWERRRRRYREALASGNGLLAIATGPHGPIGYAFAIVHAGPDDTFEYEGESYGELFSLSVAEDARGQGVGSRLCDVIEAELSARGVTELEVAVMVGNDEAARFYRRRGFQPSEELLRRPIGRGR